MKKALSLLLAMALLFALCVPALAAEDYAPFTLHSHYWKAYVNGYIGIFTFSAAKIEPGTTTDTPYEYTESSTLHLKPGSTVTIENDGSGLTGPDFDAIITAYTSAGEEYWVSLKAGTYTVEALFGQLDVPDYTNVTAGFQSGTGLVGPFSSFYLAAFQLDANSRMVKQEYTILLDQDESPAAPTIVLSPQKLTVDGQPIDCEKYNIDGSNYFMLRDIAFLLNGTGSQFALDWDDATRTVSITTGAPYEPDGSELQTGADKSASAVVGNQTIMIDGAVCAGLSVFNMGDRNYFKLRDLAEVLNFDVDFDETSNTAIILSR